jgi:hypothetical protein
MGLTSINMNSSPWGLPKSWDMNLWRIFKKHYLDIGFDETEIEANLRNELLIIDKYGIKAIKKNLDRSVLGENENANIRRA